MERPQKLTVIACGVFERELHRVARESENQVDVELLDAGLHAVPDRLRLRAQEVVDSVAREGRHDAVCLAYGLCGRGTAGLVARSIPIVIPRVHDCISLFLGSTHEYQRQFRRHPGTFYFTTGWYEKKAHPERTRIAAARKHDPTKHPQYGEFSEHYGEDNARFIVEFLESWRSNYQRAALIDHGFASEEHVEATRRIAEAAGWEYERLEGSLRLLKRLVDGDWNEDEFLVVPPEHLVVPTNDARIFAPVPAGQGQKCVDVAGDVREGTFLYGEASGDAGRDDILGLGIDAGGTYTDAVLCDLGASRLIGKAKALTTHHHLVDGIAAALGGLDGTALRRVNQVCLSTTLATNAIVEGRGQPVGLLLMPYHEGLASQVRTPLMRLLGARMTIDGVEEVPVDEDDVRKAAGSLLEDGAASFAVSGYGAVRNPKHENQVREILQAEFGLPVVCGHELSGRLNFIARAHTAVLNARLIPLIESLLQSVERVLADSGVDAPLFIVRGDGSIMRRAAARMRAVETVLSGPAASAAGGRLLTGQRDALVVDMGGTTTDVAALRDGRLDLTPEGAQVGRWRTSVTAADIQTAGLGGDSHVQPAGTGKVRVGPRRVVPLSYLAAHWPHVSDELEELLGQTEQGGVGADALDFFVLVGRPREMSLRDQEARIAQLLAPAPQSRLALSRACGCLSSRLLRIGRLEDIGLVRRAAVTPTDALHVLGHYAPYDTEAARKALQMLGHFVNLEAEQAARLIVQEVERQLALTIVRRELSVADGGLNGEDFERYLPILDRAVSDTVTEEFDLLWRQRRPVVGIGAPVSAYLPGACRRLGTKPIVPPDADVANAVGAVTSCILVRESVRVRPGEFGRFILFAPDGREEFSTLSRAEEAARRHVVGLVRQRGQSFGTLESQVRVQVRRRVGRVQDGSAQLLEVEVQGEMEGAPALTMVP